MPAKRTSARQNPPVPARERAIRPGYKGKQTRTGNSLALRFDRALFQSHPEFSGEVNAYVIAPGRMLVVAETREAENSEDPVLASFLSFLARDMEQQPSRIQPLDSSLMDRIEELTQGAAADNDEPLGNEELL